MMMVNKRKINYNNTRFNSIKINNDDNDYDGEIIRII